MATIKISQLPPPPNGTGSGSPQGTDLVPATDVTDTTSAASGTTKKYTQSAILNFYLHAQGLTVYSAVLVATTASLTVTYSNGTSGVGATLTNAGVQAALSIDGVTLAVGDRVLVKNQASTFQNGIYVVSNIGSGSTNWVMTRATDYDQASEIVQYGVVLVNQGTVSAGLLYQETAAGPFTIGTSPITFAAYSAGSSGSTGTVNIGTANQTAYYASAGNTISGVGPGSSGQIYQSNGSGSAPAFTTATYPSTTTVSQLLYSSSSNVVAGLATANSAALVTTNAGVPVWSSTMTNGQLIIGSTGATPSAATLTAGTGISITNGAASITIAASGSSGWVDQTTASVTMAVNTGYTADAGASLITFTLPATASIGDFVEINGKGSGLYTIAQGAGQQIHFDSLATTSGATGTLSSINQYDCIRLRCITANTTWSVVSSVGNFTIV